VQTVLSLVGLDDRQEAAYRALVAMGAATAPELARRLELPAVPDARALLADLENRGLAMPSPGRPEHFTAAPPALALGAALTERRHELNQAELAISQLAEAYRLGSADVSLHELFEPVTGPEPIRRRFEQLQLSAEHEVLALVTAAPTVVTGEQNEAEPLAVSRGVSFRVVAERTVLDAPSGLTELSEALNREEQVRVVDRVPAKLLIADRQTALIPLHGWSGRPAPAEPAALVVYAGGLVEALVALFEQVWSTALPVRVGETGTAESPEVDRPDETDLRILSLLLLGLTDASVAKQLDLGLRTIQRRVKNLMDLAGVTTRMQLGWHAYERGWVSRERPRGAY
jgi:sugar-specific transcriptional regulator TrmB